MSPSFLCLIHSYTSSPTPTYFSLLQSSLTCELHPSPGPFVCSLSLCPLLYLANANATSSIIITHSLRLSFNLQIQFSCSFHWVPFYFVQLYSCTTVASLDWVSSVKLWAPWRLTLCGIIQLSTTKPGPLQVLCDCFKNKRMRWMDGWMDGWIDGWWIQGWNTGLQASGRSQESKFRGTKDHLQCVNLVGFPLGESCTCFVY